MKLNGVELIKMERERQVAQEGWSVKHDAELADGVLERAAACYALEDVDPMIDLLRDTTQAPRIWPWGQEWWKPHGRLRNLIKAGALIAAAIDKILAEE